MRSGSDEAVSLSRQTWSVFSSLDWFLCNSVTVIQKQKLLTWLHRYTVCWTYESMLSGSDIFPSIHFVFWAFAEGSEQNNHDRGKAECQKNQIIRRKNAKHYLCKVIIIHGWFDQLSQLIRAGIKNISIKMFSFGVGWCQRPSGVQGHRDRSCRVRI